MTQALTRRQTLQALGASLLPMPLIVAAQAAFPNKPVRIIVPLPASGAADVSVRILTEFLQQPLGQSLVVENRPGGVYQIGIQAITSAPADGYTLIHLNATMCAVQASLKRFDMLKQLIPVGYMGSTDSMLCIANNAPFKTTQEMIAWGKANPGKLNYGSSGPGSMEHLSMVSIMQRVGITGNNIPFKGGPDGALALAQGEIHAMPLAAPLIIQFKDKFKPVIALSEQRSGFLPDLPTAKEQGLDIPTVNYWGGLAAPAGTPASVIETLEKAMSVAVNNPALVQKYVPLGLNAKFAGSASFKATIEKDLQWLGDAVKSANLQLS
ncbi:tripartite tricarboxylate transporter substrate binding protein [Limnohabitans sp. Rim8]|uniref:Bug family tripartite tricarboxylate transporter substrate binding protein n=1 Tax=Limnohabitans sp. Rim8 TaxID=1100718 RepID=UPI002634F4C4|nr:tripartite tricarboxylate transporter substrate binding protein [Limnohabitans sp. Rim8]